MTKKQDVVTFQTRFVELLMIDGIYRVIQKTIFRGRFLAPKQGGKTYIQEN